MTKFKYNFMPSLKKFPTKPDNSFLKKEFCLTEKIQIRKKNNLKKNKGFSNYSINSLAPSFLTKSQIESCKKIINRLLKKYGLKCSVILHYNFSKTKKSIGSRMGKGKGKVSEVVAFVKKHDIIFGFTTESNFVPDIVIDNIIFKIRYKLPIPIQWENKILY